MIGFSRVTAVLGLLLCFFSASIAQETSEVVDLTVENFEHLTQASTGATTGDWFVGEWLQCRCHLLCRGADCLCCVCRLVVGLILRLTTAEFYAPYVDHWL